MMDHSVNGFANLQRSERRVIHPKAQGAVYNDPAYPNTNAGREDQDQDVHLPEYAGCVLTAVTRTATARGTTCSSPVRTSKTA